MPGASALDTIPELITTRPGLAIVVMTMEADPADRPGGAHRAPVRRPQGRGGDGTGGRSCRTVAGGTYLEPGIGARLAATPLPAPAAAPAQAQAVALEPLVGSMFADHRLDAVAGRGLAVVYRATDLVLDRTVALKLITPAVAQGPVVQGPLRP